MSSDARGEGRSPSERVPGTIVVYGRRAVLEALAEPRVEVLGVRVDRQVPASFGSELDAACRARGVAVEAVSLAEINRLTGDPRQDQGVAARIRLTHVLELESFVQSLGGSAAARPVRVLAIDAITNPQNVGMIVRSVVAFGLDGLLWPQVGCPWVSGLIIKASAACVYRCPILRCGALEEGLWTLQRAGFLVYGLDAEGEQDLHALRPAHRAVFVLGSETAGLSASVRATLDARVRIDMAAGVDSLNAAVAAGIVCFCAARGRAPTPTPGRG